MTFFGRRHWLHMQLNGWSFVGQNLVYLQVLHPKSVPHMVQVWVNVISVFNMSRKTLWSWFMLL
jgi:hypothetical protein